MGNWRDPEAPDAESLRTFTVITGEPNALVAPIHDRMPVILPRERYAPWLSPHTQEAELASMLVPFPGERMHAYPISSRVNSPCNDDAALIDEVPADRPLPTRRKPPSNLDQPDLDEHLRALRQLSGDCLDGSNSVALPFAVMKTSPLRFLVLSAVSAICFLGSALAGHPQMEKAFSLLKTAQELLESVSPTKGNPVPILEAAHAALKKAPSNGKYKGHRAEAMEEVDAALAAMKVEGGTKQALEHVKKGIAHIHAGGGLSK